MPIYRDKARGCLVFEFDRLIEGKRVRARKHLPKAWSKAQADAYERKESARLYAIAVGTERQDFLIEDAVAVYLKERALALKSGDIIAKELGLIMWVYQGRKMSELPEVCQRYDAEAIKDSGEPLAASTKRNRIRYLTSACRYAWKRHSMATHDPAEKVISPSVRNERRHFLSREDMVRVARACRCRSARAAIRRAFYSGMRMGEILGAEVKDGLFVLADTKNGEPRHVPVHPKIRCTLGVPMKDKYWTSKRFKEAARACGLGHLRFHDLRHSAASAMINAGVDLYTVGTVLGHKSAVSTKRYAHLATDNLRDALGKIGTFSPSTKRKRAA